jgi:hypothetical protein
VCYSRVVTLTMAHYIADLPMTQCKLHKGYFRYSITRMQEWKTRIEIPMNYRARSNPMKTSVVETSLHMYTNENLEMQT